MLSLSATAVAVPQLRSMLNQGAFGSMAQADWEDCSSGTLGNGRRINAEATGYDNSGNVICTSTAFTTGIWQLNTGSCAGATQNIARVRRNFLTDCQTSLHSWTTRQHCTVDIVTRDLAGPNVCTAHTFRGYAEGI
jgi:hypothetical protein